MTTGIKYQTKIHFRCGRNGRKHLETGETPVTPSKPAACRSYPGSMALAIRFDGLIRDGVVADQAELARLGHVTRARVTQIMNLLQLAPDIQEALLFLPRVEQGPGPDPRAADPPDRGRFGLAQAAADVENYP